MWCNRCVGCGCQLLFIGLVGVVDTVGAVLVGLDVFAATRTQYRGRYGYRPIPVSVYDILGRNDFAFVREQHVGMVVVIADGRAFAKP